MKIYSNKTVLEAGIERIRFLFDEFPNIVVGISGGKDSTVVLNLTLQVAREKGRLPLKVMWIDQEAEWQGTVDYCTEIMTSPDIEPMWFQMPMVITNNASSFHRYSNCWAEEDKEKWIHPQHPISIKVNKYGTERFHQLFEAIMAVEFKGEKACYVSGVRTEETPKRFVALTEGLTYKWITWGKVLHKKYQHYTFYPIYDWSYTDVWKYIHDNNIKYNRIYDEIYRHGGSLNDMRISNLHHETAIQSLLLVQEIEPETWDRVTARIDGASSIKHIKTSSFRCPEELPAMFSDWEEYAIYLAENIIQEPEHREQLYKQMKSKSLNTNAEFHNNFSPVLKKQYWKKVIDTILSSDWDFTKLTNFALSHEVMECRRFYKKEWSKLNWEQSKNNKYFTEEQKDILWKQLNQQSETLTAKPKTKLNSLTNSKSSSTMKFPK